LVAVTLAFRHGVSLDDGVGINYHLDGNLFNIRRLRTQTKTASDHIFELQYADDAALPGHTAEGLQRNLDTIATAYERAGLIVNTKMNEVLIQEASQHNANSPSFSIAGDAINKVRQFTYLGSILNTECTYLLTYSTAPSLLLLPLVASPSVSSSTET